MGIVKRFIVQSKVLEITIGMIVAVAFDRVIITVVSDILVPLFNLFESAWAGKDSTILRRVGSPAASQVVVAVEYGRFVEAAIAFLIIMFFIVKVVKTVERLRKRERLKPEDTTSETNHLI